MDRQRQQSPRIWVLLAREAPVAVVFSRGPSRQVRLLKWNLRTNQFESGQWFKGRIYERRCDLSPDGKLLVYFASKQSRSKNPTWTAISKPPYLTALALWYNGTCWNGGGIFLANDSVNIDPGMFDATPAPGQNLEKKMRVTMGSFPGGEDAPVWHTILRRDGWKSESPKIWEKSHPENLLTLEMAIRGTGKQRGWYDMRYRVLSGDSCILPEMEADWADWDHKGDLLYAQYGKIYRQRHHQGGFLPPKLLIDLNGQKFENIEPPASATRW